MVDAPSDEEELSDKVCETALANFKPRDSNEKKRDLYKVPVGVAANQDYHKLSFVPIILRDIPNTHRTLN